MKQPQGPTASPAGGRWLYPLLLAMQTIGVVVVYWNGLPLYRELVGDPSAYPHRGETRAWALTAIVLIQAGYWLRYWLRPALPRIFNALLGHLVQFVARLAFTLATAIFSFVFITQKLGSQMPVARHVLTLTVLFSLFLYMQELQRLGNYFISSGEKA